MATPSPRPTTRSPRTEHGLSALAIDVGVDPRDVEVVTCWLTPDDEHLDDAELEAEPRGILDPAAQRTTGSGRPVPSAAACWPEPRVDRLASGPLRGHTTT